MRKHLFRGLLLVTVGCSGPVSEQEPGAVAPPVASIATAETDEAPVQTVRQFLDWYAVHMDSLTAIPLVSLRETAPDSLESFEADYKAIERWLNMVQRSERVSPNYLNHWRTHFHNYADTLRLNSHGSPPIGFDYDFIMLSQEPDTDAADLKTGTLIVKQQQKNRAVVQARGPRHDSWQVGLDFVLIKTPKNQWLIDSISNAGSTF